MRQKESKTRKKRPVVDAKRNLNRLIKSLEAMTQGYCEQG